MVREGEKPEESQLLFDSENTYSYFNRRDAQEQRKQNPAKRVTEKEIQEHFKSETGSGIKIGGGKRRASSRERDSWIFQYHKFPLIRQKDAIMTWWFLHEN